VGCNIDCKFCQNWEISQANPDDRPVAFQSPADIIALALKQKIKPKTIAYTYNEPTVFFEYMIDCARAARDAGLGNIVISNGYIAEKPLKELCKHITAMKVDLKAFSQQFYGKICNGRLNPVLDTLKRLSDSNVWFEIVVLLIPTLNDNKDELKRMAAWIVKELGPDVPLHFTRFHPQYKLKNIPPTPTRTFDKARQIAVAEGCNYVYGGNMPGIMGENTYCPKCRKLLVDRYGHSAISTAIQDGKCNDCKADIPGVWK
jgi:pyruvate formate lyase activating enzyme